MEIRTVKPNETTKVDMVKTLHELRASVDSGECVGLIVVEIRAIDHTNRVHISTDALWSQVVGHLEMAKHVICRDGV